MKMDLFSDNFVALLSSVLIYGRVNSAPRKAVRRILGKNLAFSANKSGS